MTTMVESLFQSKRLPAVVGSPTTSPAPIRKDSLRRSKSCNLEELCSSDTPDVRAVSWLVKSPHRHVDAVISPRMDRESLIQAICPTMISPNHRERFVRRALPESPKSSLSSMIERQSVSLSDLPTEHTSGSRMTGPLPPTQSLLTCSTCQEVKENDVNRREVHIPAEKDIQNRREEVRRQISERRCRTSSRNVNPPQATAQGNVVSVNNRRQQSQKDIGSTQAEPSSPAARPRRRRPNREITNQKQSSNPQLKARDRLHVSRRNVMREQMKEKNRIKREVSRQFHPNDRSGHRKDQNHDGSSFTVRSASSLDSSVTFSSTILAQMLAKEGVTAGKDFEVQQKSSRNCTHPSSEAPKSPTKEKKTNGWESSNTQETCDSDVSSTLSSKGSEKNGNLTATSSLSSSPGGPARMRLEIDAKKPKKHRKREERKKMSKKLKALDTKLTLALNAIVTEAYGMAASNCFCVQRVPLQTP